MHNYVGKDKFDFEKRKSTPVMLAMAIRKKLVFSVASFYALPNYIHNYIMLA